jgi:cholesterol transport system auxiliary component
MTASHRIAAACAAALALAGCSILGGSKEPPTIYAPEAQAAADPAWPRVDWQLGIVRPDAPRMLDSSRIAVSPVAGELQVYKGAAWARTPAEMLQDGVARTLEDSGRIPAVARPGSGIRADYRLLMDLRHFEARYDGAATPSAVIEVNAVLVKVADHAVVGSRTFREARPAAGTQPAVVADAFAQALQATSRDLAGWVLATGQAHAARHPDTR